MSLFSSKKLSALIDGYKSKTGRRLTIREIAKETDVSPAYLTLLKNGQRNNPSMDVVVKLSHFFQVAPEELLEDSEGPPAARPREEAPAAASQAELTLQLSEQLIISGNPAQALDLVVLLENAPEAKTPYFQTELQLVKARALSVLKRYDECTDLLDACMQRSITQEQQAKALQIRGRIHYFRERYTLAIHDLLQANDLAQGSQGGELLYQIHYLLGICYKETYEYGSSIYYFESAQRLFPESLPVLQKGHLLMGMGNTYLRLMSVGAALHAYRSAEQIYREIGDHKLIADIQHNVARVKMMEDKYEDAVSTLQESLRAHQMVGDHLGIAADLLEIAHCCKEMQRWEEMQEHAFRASVTFENGNKQGQAAQAKLLMIEAWMQRKQVPDTVFDEIDSILQVFTELDWHLFQAQACHIKATLLLEAGRADEALAMSMQALDLYGKYSQPAKHAE